MQTKREVLRVDLSYYLVDNNLVVVFVVLVVEESFPLCLVRFNDLVPVILKEKV